MKGVNFSIVKSFGKLDLMPAREGLGLIYTPIVDGRPDSSAPGFLSITIPVDVVGGLWTTARAFLYGVEALDENIILKGEDSADVLIKLYRDKPKGPGGKLTGEEYCWLRIVTGRSEEERRRIRLGPRDLLAIELACNVVAMISSK